MTQSVAEILIKTRICDDLPGHSIHISTFRTGTDRLDSTLLCLQHKLVNTFEFGRNFTGVQDTRQVTFVAIGRISTPVDQQQTMFTDGNIFNGCMGKGGSRTHSHDWRKATTSTAKTSNLIFNGMRHGSLLIDATQSTADRVEGSFGKHHRLSNGSNFIAILHHP